ncbi:MAG: DMT family transporter [Bryobacterales bacterium]|nr:DMT family transporter [Bryobacterales bacterium]
MPSSRERLKYDLLLVAAAVLFSTAGAAIKATTINSWQVASLRSLAGALALLLFLPAARRDWSVRLAPVSIAFAATLVLFAISTKLTTAANAIFLESTAPVYILLLGPLLLREKSRLADVLFILVIAVGMWLIFSGHQRSTAQAVNPPLGNKLAAAAGFTWACAVMGLRWMGKRRQGDAGALAMIVLANLLACAATLPMALPVRLGWTDFAAILYLGIFQVGLAYVCMTRAMPHVRAFEASVLLLVEPALNPVWTWLLRGEHPALPAVAGGGIILAATLGKSWAERGRLLIGNRPPE